MLSIGACLPSWELLRTLLMRSQHWFRYKSWPFLHWSTYESHCDKVHGVGHSEQLKIFKIWSKSPRCSKSPWFTVYSQIARYMGPTWVLSAPGGPHVGPINLAIRIVLLPSRWFHTGGDGAGGGASGSVVGGALTRLQGQRKLQNRSTTDAQWLGPVLLVKSLIYYKTHHITNFKCFSSRLAVVFVQSIETRY